jgi:hypothetical protein
MTKSEADKLCFKWFGMSSDDYTKRIMKAWEENRTKDKEKEEESR